MTVFLLLVCGTLIVVLFAKLANVRQAGVRQGAALRALQARVEELELAGGHPAPQPTPARPAAARRGRAASETLHPRLPTSGPERDEWAPKRQGPTVGQRIAAQLRIGWDQWVAQNLLAAAGGTFVLVGASFFVAIAISNGWLTPWRQVAAALIGGGLLLVAGWRAWPVDRSRRAAYILAQSLVGTGAGVMLLAVVAGARIYDQPLYAPWVGLLGAGAISAILVATSVRWHAQVTAALGITAAVAAPFLVDAPASMSTVAFTLVALAAAAVVIALRGWPWLLQAAIAGSLLQPARWAIDDQIGHHSTALLLAILVAWWALLALPALFFEVRADTPRLRMPTSGALFAIASLAALFGRVAFGSFHASGFETLLCVLAGLHLVCGAVMLRARPSSQPGAVFVWAVGAALAAGAAAVLLGGAAQPAFWGVEALAMLWLYVRFSDKQAGVSAALLGVLTLGWTLHLSPPTALGHPLAPLATGVLAVGAVVVMLGGAAFLARRLGDAATALAAAAWVALLYLVAVLVVGLIAPAGHGVDQTAQLFVSGAWAALATAAAVAGAALPRRFRSRLRLVAEATLWTVAVKALALDSLVLGVHAPRLLWLLAAVTVLAALLVAIERRLPASRLPLPLPLATPVGLLVLLSALTQPGPDAYRAGTSHLLETLAVLSLAILASSLAVWRYPVRARAGALVVAVLLVTQAVALATVTLITPQLGMTSELAQRAVSVGPLLLALALLGAGMLVRRVPPDLRPRLLECAAGLLALAAVLAVADTAVFGATGRAVVVAGFWLVAAIALSLAVRARPSERLLVAALAGAVAVCAFVLVTTGPPRSLAYGAAHGWWALAAATMTTLAAAVAAAVVPSRWRTGAVAVALSIALYGVSVLVVTALTPHAGHVAQAAQLALSIVWTVWGVGLLGAGVARRSPLGLFLRRGGIALAGIAAAKVVLVDTAQFDTAHRAGVFLALGLILLAGAYAYARLTKRLDANPV